MKLHDEQESRETMSKRRRGFQLRDPRQAGHPNPQGLQGAGGEARPQRPLPLRLGQAIQALLLDQSRLSSIAAITSAEHFVPQLRAIAYAYSFLDGALQPTSTPTRPCR